MIQRAIEEALKSKADDLVVILGWKPELIQEGILSKNIDVVINENWEQGMASSMQAGLQFFEKEKHIDQMILMLCDQPYVSSSILNQLMEEKEKSEKGIVACSYSKTLGVPALFDQKYFQEMLQLKGSEGAKKVILKHPEDVFSIEFPEGEVDLDTEEDLKRLENWME